jgi:hypothetical protein
MPVSFVYPQTIVISSRKHMLFKAKHQTQNPVDSGDDDVFIAPPQKYWCCGRYFV